MPAPVVTSFLLNSGSLYVGQADATNLVFISGSNFDVDSSTFEILGDGLIFSGYVVTYRADDQIRGYFQCQFEGDTPAAEDRLDLTVIVMNGNDSKTQGTTFLDLDTFTPQPANGHPPARPDSTKPAICFMMTPVDEILYNSPPFTNNILITGPGFSNAVNSFSATATGGVSISGATLQGFTPPTSSIQGNFGASPVGILIGSGSMTVTVPGYTSCTRTNLPEVQRANPDTQPVGILLAAPEGPAPVPNDADTPA